MNRVLLLLLAVMNLTFNVRAKELLEIKGDYLLYSYDFNYIYGQGNIFIKNKDFSIQAVSVEIDMVNHVAMASRNCRVQLGKENYAADILEIDLENLNLRLTTFKDNIFSKTLTTQKKGAEVKDAAAKNMIFRDYETLKKSLLYYLNNRIVITGSYRLYGYQCTVFVEGIQSLAFKKLKMDKGIPEQDEQGLGIDNILIFSSQGTVVNSRLFLEKATKNGFNRTSSMLGLMYDFFGTEAVGSRGKINFNSVNSLTLGKKSGLALNINYLTGNMFNTSMNLKTQWAPSFNSEWVAEYSRTAAKREEMWLRLRSGFSDKVLGDVSLNLAYEKERQYLMEISLQNQTVKNFVISAQHSRSRLLYDQNQYNRMSNSVFSLSYSTKLFNLVADYSFHKDLLQNQSQTNPQFRLNASPFRLYHGLLQFNIFSNFMVNQLNHGVRSDSFRKANMGLAMQSETIQLGRGTRLSFSLAAEQLLDQDLAGNFTSLGYILKCSQNLTDFADFNFLFNYQTRRKTDKWFIQGTTSQDWSAVLKLKEKENRIQGWISLSYDNKSGRFTNSLVDCSIAIIKNWYLQTQMNYDFIFKNFSYDLYLIRRAGRIMIRGSYRSLSRQFSLEVLPN